MKKVLYFLVPTFLLIGCDIGKSRHEQQILEQREIGAEKDLIVVGVLNG